MTSALCEQTIQKLLEAYPILRSEILTTSAFGRPIHTLVIGDGDRKVLYSAAHHANEWITTPLLLKFAEELAQAIVSGGTLFGVPADTIRRSANIIPGRGTGIALSELDLPGLEPSGGILQV